MSVENPTARVEYRDISDFPGYRVGDDGSVWTCLERYYFGTGRRGVNWMMSNTWKRLKPQMVRRHFAVGLRRDGKLYHRTVHRLVLENFVGPRPLGMQACHFDDDPWNNSLTNLRWDTPKANAADAIRNGRLKVGEENSRAKLTSSQVQEIRERYTNGSISQKRLALIYNVSQTVISGIIYGKTWNKVPGPRAERPPNPIKLTQDKADEIRQLVSGGMHRRDVARQYGVSAATISLIMLGKAWNRKSSVSI